jgi:hypothetical protein
MTTPHELELEIDGTSISEVGNDLYEMELDQKVAASIALFFYRKWKEAMQPPSFSVLAFEEWLERIIND